MNVVKDLLKAGGTAVGTSAGANSEVAFLADSGFDFLLFDTQHSPDEIKSLGRPVAATRGRKAVPIIRVGDNRPDQICYALDQGARGIIVPMVNTAEEARNMVKWCKYPFEGERSSSGPHGEWGEFKNYREYMDAVNEQLLVIPMIETVEAMENLEDILSVPGIDVLLIGPSDLSINLDVALDYQNPKYHAALDTIAAACKKAGVAPGMFFVPPGISPAELIAKGYQFFTLPWGGWATEGIRNGVASIKG
ncbi:MAG: aldolase/citrate lyase family protein [Proteobacteria bacterium]|jgi:2-keto-3-deoxy-L-rhamnonate aldolase RhmA|nr:aldolase/citrate lyase family protein [Pseudomonadota bacterium]